jgi:hypothetical protein
MADTKISALPASTVPLAGTEVLPIVQSSTTKQVSVANLTAGRSFDALGMTLTSTDAGATAAPLLELYRDSASPAVSDTIGEIEFNGEDSAGNKQAYGLIHASILSPTSTAEQGQIHFETATAGALTEKMIIGTTNLVINEIGAVYNVRIEGDTDPNLFYTDATNDRIGIGTSSPLVRLHVVTTGTGTAMGDNSVATFRSTVSGRASTIQLSDGTNSNYVSSLSGALGFGSAGVELMRMTTGGDLLLGTSTKLTGGIDGLDINTAAETGITFAQSGTNKAYFYLSGGGTGTAWQWQTVSGITADVVSNTNGVTLANGSTSWGALSDERKKDIIEPIVDAATKVSSLRAVIGKYKTEEDGIRRAMLIAQDVQAVLPEAVVENKDGDLILQYTDIIPLLVAAIKEQSVELEFLKTEITKLKGI